ncbi:hypothetical protein HYU18_03970 [Candidatus Woesearchaeota archaeon]|nr:hypothetical protein [Candidatus Woesearchaeota archaeon]
MEIRKVQRSGSTFYLYLPAAWCKANRIDHDSQLTLDMSSEGNLVLSSNPEVASEKEITLTFSESNGKLDSRLLNMFIVASYLNPVKSFKIKLSKPISSLDILDQKRLMSGIELVEFGDDSISCESTVSVEDPDVILRTMIRKIINMIRVMGTPESRELVQRYEEEIDRSNTLIQKSAISSLMFKRPSKLRHIELFYIAMISKSLEGLADHLILTTLRQGKGISEPVHLSLQSLLKCLEALDYHSAASFASDVLAATANFDEKDIHAHRIKSILQQLSETLIDWSVTNEVEVRK